MLKPLGDTFTGFSLYENNPEEKVIPKILILTQARSGSTFLSSILSASPNSYFIDEPFQRIEIDKTELDVLINNNNTMANAMVKIMLENLFNCNYQPDRISVRNLKQLHYVYIKTISVKKD